MVWVCNGFVIGAAVSRGILWGLPGIKLGSTSCLPFSSVAIIKFQSNWVYLILNEATKESINYSSHLSC